MAKNSEAKKLYDWENDPELATREPEEEKSFIDELYEVIVIAALLALAFFAVVAASNFFFGPRTYFVSYNYTLEGQNLFWGSGQTYVSYKDKINTSNCENFTAAAQSEIEKKLHLQDGGHYKSVIVSYQEVPRSLSDLLRF